MFCLFVCLLKKSTKYWILNISLIYYYYFYIKYSSAPITAKDIKKEKENMHRPIHSELGPIWSLFSFIFGPIRSRLAEHNKKVKLGKSIRSKLFSPIHTFSQSPLSSVIACGNVGYNQHNVVLLWLAWILLRYFIVMNFLTVNDWRMSVIWGCWESVWLLRKLGGKY